MLSTPSTEKRVALITGASWDAAYEIAFLLGREHGMIVLIGAPDEQSGQESAARLAAGGIDARPVRLDVTDPPSIAAAVRWVGATFDGCLDVLINHAGAVPGNVLPGHAASTTFKETFEATVHGPFLVSDAMLPLLKRSSAGRIVNVLSGLYSMPQSSDSTWEFAPYRVLCYKSSKAALHMQTVLFASELARSGTSIKINAAEIGDTATEVEHSERSPAILQGARAVVRLATLAANGPSGGFFDAQRPVPW